MNKMTKGNGGPHRAISYRESASIDYANPTVMRARRKLASLRRKPGAYVLGRWIICDGRISFEAVAQQVGFWVDKQAGYTTHVQDFYRWATRQAVHQWICRNPRFAELQVVNLEALLRRGVPLAVRQRESPAS